MRIIFQSKCDAFNLEEVKYHDTYSGSRTKRGLFISSSGLKLNSDVNGAINILRKYVNHKCTDLTTRLNEIIKTTKSTFCNPYKIYKWNGKDSTEQYKVLLNAF